AKTPIIRLTSDGPSADASADVAMPAEPEAPAAAEVDPRLVPVWFGTHRRPVDATDAARGFSNEESDFIYYGRCNVSVPKSHRLAGKKTLWERLTLGIGTENFEVVERGLLAPDVFWGELGNALGRKMADSPNAVLLFIHGYKNSFDDAAAPTAQLKLDLKIPHAVFY